MYEILPHFFFLIGLYHYLFFSVYFLYRRRLVAVINIIGFLYYISYFIPVLIDKMPMFFDLYLKYTFHILILNIVLFIREYVNHKFIKYILVAIYTFLFIVINSSWFYSDEILPIYVIGLTFILLPIKEYRYNKKILFNSLLISFITVTLIVAYRYIFFLT